MHTLEYNDLRIVCLLGRACRKMYLDLKLNVFRLFVCVVGLKQDLARRHKDALQTCKSHNLPLVKSNQQAELEVRLLSYESRTSVVVVLVS